MKNRQPSQIRSLIVDIVALIVYIVICIGLISYCPKHPADIQTDHQNWASVLLASLINSAAIVLDVAAILAAVVLAWRKKEIPKREIAVFSIAFLIFVNFNMYALHYPFDNHVIVLVDGIIYVVCASKSLLLKPKPPITDNSRHEKVLGRITHKAIIAEQLYSYRRTEKNDYVIYSVTSDEYTARSENAIRGILSVTYRLPREDDNTISFIRETYNRLVNEGNDDTRTKLIRTLKSEAERLTDKLKTIPRVDDVSEDDCCLARLLIVCLAYMRILDPPHADNPDNPKGKGDGGWHGTESYIGELSLNAGELGLDIEIEKKLFEYLRTGLLGAILVGSGLRYIFNFRINGLNNGRMYSATELRDTEGNNMNRICLFTLAGIDSLSVPPYIVSGISKEEERVTKKLVEIRKKRSEPDA